MAQTWGPDQRDAVQTRFSGSGLAFAEEAAPRVVAILDDYAAAWVDMRTEACRATRVRGDQSEGLMDLRMACLDRRREQLDAFVQVLSDAEREEISQAVTAARGLPTLAPCADAQQLRLRVAPPSDPKVREQVELAEAEAARMVALELMGHYKDAIEPTRALLQTAREIGHVPLIAETAHILARALESAAQPDDAYEMWQVALEHAAEGSDLYLEAAVLPGFAVHLVVARNDVEGAQRDLRLANGIARALGNPAATMVELRFAEGVVLTRAGRFDEAEAAYLQAITIASADPTLRHGQLDALANLGSLYGSRARHEEALETMRQVLALYDEELGSHHPRTGLAALSLGAVLARLGRRDEAKAMLARAETILSEAFGGKHPALAAVLNNQAELLASAGDLDGAEKRYQRALQMKKELAGPDDASVGHTANNLADLYNKKGEHERALQMARTALRIWEASRGETHPFNAYAWINIGDSETALGHGEEAVTAYERALKVRQDAGQGAPELAEAKFLVAKALAAVGRDPARAQTLGREALEQTPENPAEALIPRADIEAWLATQP